LKWNEFSSNLSNSFNCLKKEDFLKDVTLVSDDEQHLSAHKLVLTACSDYFKDIFKKNNRKLEPIICLEGISSKYMNYILDYMYDGEVQIYQEDIDKFLAIAQRFKMKGLSGFPKESVKSMTQEEDKEASVPITVPLEKIVFKQGITKTEGTVALNTEDL